MRENLGDNCNKQTNTNILYIEYCYLNITYCEQACSNLANRIQTRNNSPGMALRPWRRAVVNGTEGPPRAVTILAKSRMSLKIVVLDKPTFG